MAGYIKEIREFIGSRPLILVGSTIIVTNEKEEILFQLRSDTKEWGLPGGGMEIGESLDLKYFSNKELPSDLDERARLIIEKHFI